MKGHSDEAIAQPNVEAVLGQPDAGPGRLADLDVVYI